VAKTYPCAARCSRRVSHPLEVCVPCKEAAQEEIEQTEGREPPGYIKDALLADKGYGADDGR
jgi:hypothetical protein